MLRILSAVTLCQPPLARAQQAAKVMRIGYLHPERPASRNRPFQQLRRALEDLGYVEGKNVVFEYRTASGAPERLPALAAELASANVGIIVAGGGTRPVLAAMSATRTIPIVFPTAYDPVASGLVASLGRPGGNVTGVMIEGNRVTVKRLEMVREIFPRATQVAFMFDPANPYDAASVPQIEEAASILRMDLLVSPARRAGSLDELFDEVTLKGVEAVVLSGSPFFPAQSSRLAKLGLRHRLAIIGESPELPAGGCLASYGASREGTVRRAAALVDKVLKGAKPADLPVERATRFDLVINAATARTLGIDIPPSLLVRADRLIE